MVAPSLRLGGDREQGRDLLGRSSLPAQVQTTPPQQALHPVADLPEEGFDVVVRRGMDLVEGEIAGLLAREYPVQQDQVEVQVGVERGAKRLSADDSAGS